MLIGMVSGIEIMERTGDYVGETKDNMAHGFGAFTCSENKTSGLFYKNKTAGLCKANSEKV